MNRRSILSLDFLRQPGPKVGKTSGMTFRPPLPNRFIQDTVAWLLPIFFGFSLRGLTIHIDETSLDRLRALQGKRCLLLPNHPSEWDPWILIEVGKRLREYFFYVSAREVFDLNGGLRGWLFQRMGVYSLVRGAADKDSFKMTKEILSKNHGRLVIFVEGEISNQNDSLLPLESGVVQLGFMALNDIYKSTGKNLEALPSLYVCPISIKYIYQEMGLSHTIEQSLQALEKATGLVPIGQSHYERVREIGLKVLRLSAQQFGYELPTDMTLTEKIRSLENFMLTKLEQIVNLPKDNELSFLDRVRRIRNIVDRILKEIPAEMTEYEERLRAHQKDILEHFYLDLDRVVNFIAIYDGYMHPEMMQGRMVEVIRRLEREVFGDYRLVHPRTAVVCAAEPIDLKPYFPTFLEDKKKAADQITRDVEVALYQGIIKSEL